MFSWLHISDTHLEAGDDYGRDVALRKLISAVKRERSLGREIDAIFITGDIVSSGSFAAYRQATRLLDDLVGAAGLSREHVFVIPGNHDVDRKQAGFLARTLGSVEDSDRYFDRHQQKYHFDRFSQFSEWYDEYFKGVRSFSRDTTCGPVESLVVEGGKIGIVPINTALFSSDGSDHEKLWIGRRCLDHAIEDLKRHEPEVTFALMHHPLSFLHGDERGAITRRLEDAVDVVLRGHFHENSIHDVASPRGRLVYLAAGAAYQSARRRKLVLFGRIEQDALRILPLRYYEEEESWHQDPTLFPNSTTKEGTFQLSSRRGRVPSSPSNSVRARGALGIEPPVQRATGGAGKYTADDLADKTAASVRNDDDVIDALMVLTGLSRGGVKRRLNRADGRVRLRNLFARWPQELQHPQATTTETDVLALATRTVASVRKDERAVAAIATITGLGERAVSNQLAEADGRSRTRTIFAERWPGADLVDGDEEGAAYSAEELASWTVAAARDDDDVLDALVSITGRSLRRVRNDLAATDGRVHLRNLFARWWPQPPESKEAAIEVSTLGSLTVASARGDEIAIAAIAGVTGLGESTISSKLSQADGRFRVRTIFSHRWPTGELDESSSDDEEEEKAHYSAAELAEWTVAAAREDDDALESLVVITGLSLRGVKRCLNGTNGRVLLRNVFAHRWPSDEDEEDEDQVEQEESAGALYSAQELAGWTVAAARDDGDAVQSLAVITGISPRWVRRHLNGANGKVRVRNLFSEHWPNEEDAGSDDDGRYSTEKLADWTAAAARRDEDAIDALTMVTGISRRWVRRHLNGVDGRTLVRNVFANHWPEAELSGEPDAEALGSCTIASIRRDPSLLAALCNVTGLSQRAVARRVEASDGRFRARTIFRDAWPSEDSEEEDDEDQLYSADELADWTVAAARNDDGALDSLVAITGLHPKWVRRHLNGVDGRTLLRTLFAHRWPSNDD